MNFAEALKRFRKKYKLTQKQAALYAGVTERVYQQYEYGKSLPSIEIVYNLANNANVSLDYLVGRTDNPEINK